MEVMHHATIHLRTQARQAEVGIQKFQLVALLLLSSEFTGLSTGLQKSGGGSCRKFTLVFPLDSKIVLL